MSHLRTLTFTPSFVERESITHTSRTQFDNTGLAQYLSRASRPAYRFTLKLEALTKLQMNSLTAAHAYHQGGRSFLWDGAGYGSVDNFSLVGEGGGARREFFLGNRNVGAGSVAIQTFRPSSGVTSAWAASSANAWPYSLTGAAGVVTFANSSNTIPASGDDVNAQWGCNYRCHFEPDGIKVVNQWRGVYSVELILTETAYTG
mgnify:CR=1 FL=1